MCYQIVHRLREVGRNFWYRITCYYDYYYYCYYYYYLGDRGNVVGWYAILQFGRPRVRIQTRSLDFFSIYHILPPSTMALGCTQPLTETSTRNFPGEYCAAGEKDWRTHRHLWDDFLGNVGSSASHDPVGFHNTIAVLVPANYSHLRGLILLVFIFSYLRISCQSKHRSFPNSSFNLKNSSFIVVP
jgi:hypothetical protein